MVKKATVEYKWVNGSVQIGRGWMNAFLSKLAILIREGYIRLCTWKI